EPQQLVQRQDAQVVGRQPQRPGAGQEGGVAQAAAGGAQEDLAGGVTFDARDARELLLVPAALLHQTRDPGREFGGFVRRALFHAVILSRPAAREQARWKSGAASARRCRTSSPTTQRGVTIAWQKHTTAAAA